MAGVTSDFNINAPYGTNGTGILEIVTDYDGTIFDLGTGSNETGIISSLEAYTYRSLGFYANYAINRTAGDERIINTDVCNIGELLRTQETIPQVSFDLQEPLDMPNYALLTGNVLATVAGASTPIVDEVVNFATLDTQVKITNRNGDGTKPTITDFNSAVLGGGTTFVEGTDYEVKKAGDDWYILAIDGGALAGATNYYLTYSYTPNSREIIVDKVDQAVKPGQIIRFTTCPDTNGKSNVIYGVNLKLSSDFNIPFTNLANGDFVPTSLTFDVARGGNFVIDKQAL